ncbi:hypothetical protein D3C72_475550 [compost metagenome]
MSLRKLSATLLAGTVTLAGTAMLTATPALALTPVSELKDVSPDHWAYNAIQTLVEKYQVMEGFPDRTFRGNKTMTRYELAAALAKVMARVEQRIAQATGQSVEVEPGVNPEDLRTIARLQREFREELDTLKARVDTIDSRLMALEKRVRVSGKMQADYRDFTSVPSSAALTSGLGATGGVSADFRVRNGLMFDAQLMEDLSFMGQLNVDVYNPQSMANPYLRGMTATPITDVYVPKAVLGYNPGWINYSAGIGALRDHMAIGSSLQDPFKSNIWTNATGGYGFVGTPGMAGTAIGTASTGTGAVGAPIWLTGTNVLVDLVDPNNSQAFEPTGNLISAAQANLGPLKVGFGVQRGALTGPYVQGGSVTNPGAGLAAGLPATVPGLMSWQQGSFGVITAGLDFGLARLQVLANSPVVTLGNTTLSDKVLGASLDLGSDALGLTAEVASTSNFAFQGLTATKGSVRLGSGNLFDTGFGAALGLVAGDNGFGGLGGGNVAGGATTGSFPGSAGGATNLFAGQAGYHSWGLMLKTPAFFIIPSLTLAAQNTGTGLTPAGLGATAFGSGATIQTDFQLFGLPTLTAEYSLAKFGTGADQTIWGSAPWTHEQLALRTQVKF